LYCSESDCRDNDKHLRTAKAKLVAQNHSALVIYFCHGIKAKSHGVGPAKTRPASVRHRTNLFRGMKIALSAQARPHCGIATAQGLG
jgi:hypothetical protein